MKGLFGKAEQKKCLEQVTVLGSVPASAEEWGHVARCLALQKRLRELALRWNALAHDLKIERVAGENPEHGLEAGPVVWPLPYSQVGGHV